MNPNAIVFWAVCGLVGYFINHIDGALVGVLTGLILSLLASILPDK